MACDCDCQMLGTIKHLIELSMVQRDRIKLLEERLEVVENYFYNE